MQRAAELVSLAQQGDSQAFAELYETYSPVVYRFLRRRLDGSDEVVQDLTADVFVKVYEKLDRYVERGLPFTAWLYRIAHNHLIDHVRAQPKQGIVSIDDCLDLPEQRSERTLDLALTHTELAAAITHLTEDQRRVVVLRFLQGMSTAETARMLGKTEDAVKKLQARGLQVLKKTLSGTRQVLAVA